MNHTNLNVVTPTRKRKDRGELLDNAACLFYNHKGASGNSHKSVSCGGNTNNIKSTTSLSSSSSATRTPIEPGFNNSSIPLSSNRLLAGYMAHEFLTRGTLFGQKFDPARAEAIPVLAAQPKRKPVSVQSGFEQGAAVKPMSQSYVEVAQLLKNDEGTHIPGIVNPTQLAQWIQM